VDIASNHRAAGRATGIRRDCFSRTFWTLAEAAASVVNANIADSQISEKKRSSFCVGCCLNNIAFLFVVGWKGSKALASNGLPIPATAHGHSIKAAAMATRIVLVDPSWVMSVSGLNMRSRISAATLAS
jgi:hypothetical protein